jgi:hypothetical protein
MVGMFYGDSKTRPFPYLAHRYFSRLSAAFSGPNVRYWHKADMPSCTAHVRF